MTGGTGVAAPTGLGSPDPSITNKDLGDLRIATTAALGGLDGLNGAFDAQPFAQSIGFSAVQNAAAATAYIPQQNCELLFQPDINRGRLPIVLATGSLGNDGIAVRPTVTLGAAGVLAVTVECGFYLTYP